LKLTTTTETPRLRLFNELSDPIEKLSTLLALVPTLDDSATTRGQLITVLYIVRDY